ncbi:MAG: PIN domain-containing protein [Dehalococcoidia bacterium]
MALVFVDTNVLLYEIDPTEGTKQERAKAWIDSLWATATGRLGYQVLSEFAWNAARIAPQTSGDAIRAKMRRYQVWQPIAVDGGVFEGAWAIQDRYGISWWDALIVAAAKVAGCEYLLTEDLQDGQQFGTLRVVDPFVHEPGAVLG